MTILNSLAFGACALAAVIHLASAAIAAWRCRPRPYLQAPCDAPPVTIVRPVCGIDTDAARALGSTFALGYPAYEILFCVARPNDPAIPLIARLMDAHPEIEARLLIGDDPVSENPKLNNCVKGWREAAHEWVVLSDSNVVLPRDYLQRLFAAWDKDTGLVCAPPVGGSARNLAAEFELAFLNEYQARWQYFADTIGAGFAQGKTMLWRREFLEARGGIARLGEESAEDAASTKLVRGAGFTVRLVDAPFEQPLGVRAFRDVWLRQVRWARLRRASFPLCFALEIFSGGIWPAALAVYCAQLSGFPAVAVLGYIAVWYGAETAVAVRAGWQVSWRSPLLAVACDLLIPALWFEGWRSRAFEWRGNAMAAAPGGAG